MLASGSRMWASKPAEMMTSSGRNSRSRGRILIFESGAERFAAVAGAQRRVDHGVVRAGLDDRARAGKQRHLVGRAIHHRFVGPENLLRAVAVMHVEIDDRGTRDAVLLLRVARRDGDVVEQAKAHRPRGLGVMAGRARGDEGVGRLLGQHLVDGEDGAADRAQRRFERAGRHRGVGVEPHHAFLGRGFAQLDDVVHRMAQRDGLDGRHRRLLAGERLEFFRFQRLLDGAQPVGPLGMAGRSQMFKASGVADQESGHRDKCRMGRAPAKPIIFWRAYASAASAPIRPGAPSTTVRSSPPA